MLNQVHLDAPSTAPSIAPTIAPTTIYQWEKCTLKVALSPKIEGKGEYEF